MKSPALLALYIPMFLLALTAALLYGKTVLWKLVKRHELSPREHGLPLALFLSFATDAFESFYWGAARISSEMFMKMSFITSPIFVIKTLIMIAAIFAINAYVHTVHNTSILAPLLLLTFLVWALAYSVLMHQ